MDKPYEALEDQLTELAGLLLTEETLETALGHVADIALRAIPACDAAGISVLENDRVMTVAASGPLVRRVDDYQEAAEEGPCLETLATGEARRSGRLETDTRWPRFRPAALSEGVVSCLSLPLVIGNHGTAGALNLYSLDRPFEQADEELGRRLLARRRLQSPTHARTRGPMR